MPAATSLPAILTTVLVIASLFSIHHAKALKISSLGSVIEGFITNNNGADASINAESKTAQEDGGAPSSSSSSAATCSSDYGVDRSFPITSFDDFTHDAKNSPFDKASKQKFYEEFIQGCEEKYAPEGFLCGDTELERMEMNLRQPASMRNYTALGFHKLRAPTKVMKLLTKFWNENSQSSIPNETWNRGNTYTNHWSSQTKMLNIGDASLSGGGEYLRTAVWDASKTVLEEWTKVELTPSSLYGIRVYTDGAVLAPHVDRMPLVISAIINIAQDVDEEWPLEVYGHDGRAYNLTMGVGDMLLYESHSIIHGRPFPLVGRSYANVFIHFEPLGHTLRHEEENYTDEQSLEQLYQQAWQNKQTKCQKYDDECHARVDLNVHPKAPPYILPGSLEEMRWRQTHPRSRMTTDKLIVTTFNAHAAASIGDLDALIAMAALKPGSIRKVDENGWTPLHEAARGGHVEVVEWLVQFGLDIDQRTHEGTGGSTLWWAKRVHKRDHPVVKYLEAAGAKDIAPE